MDWLGVVAVLSLFGLAIATGGAVVRLAVAAGDVPAAASLGLVALFLLVAVAWGAHGRRWRRNPYW